MVEPLECLNSVSNAAKLISKLWFPYKKEFKIKILAIDQLIIAGIGKYALCTSSTLIKCVLYGVTKILMPTQRFIDILKKSRLKKIYEKKIRRWPIYNTY